MMRMATEKDAERVVDYVKSHSDFVYHKCDEPYGHVGATVADSILQANNRYSSVEPRVKRILTNWPAAKTVSSVLELLVTVPATQFLNWRGRDRADRFCEVLHLLKGEGVESEADLQTWLGNDTNLPKLTAIKGIGPKTADYLRIMVGLQGVAIDRRLLRFLAMAGVPIDETDYAAARDLINRAAELLLVPRSDFDHSIWRYMGSRTDEACA